MQNRLKGKWVLVTGATSGIGRAAAELFAGYGCNLVLTGRREERLKQLQDSLRKHDVEAMIFPFDIRNKIECKKFIDSLSVGVDILVNNAGLAKGVGKIYDADTDDWDQMIDTNIKGLLYITRFIAEKMKNRNSGHIINIGSTSGYETYAGGSVYTATKYAVRAITNSMKKDFHGTGIRVSSVSPGLVHTEFSKVRFDDEQKADSVYRGMQPLTAEDVAEIIIFTANRPTHVNIMDTIVYPTEQSAATMVHRSNE
ncbi:MAG TPA: SDR family NAD(P)-dependent oxidoreductase [Balneolaceae bacterium]|nr:SDR family NAD(P)-dependent oxidoreductase [Balneolaceae bacterium]